ncbi:carboxypeptidase-like regulatory domain-containing protein [Ekhidna sp. To15]|uniref:carboxypeptidase-like regulatory domain-containing protein n=1 Tax=Ekhidna sp. To15 TaxID=3395267 RepID=UPI003F51BA5C
MRASLIIAFCLILCAGFGQNRKKEQVDGHFEDLPLEAIFDSLSAQTNYFFSYNSELLPKGSRYTITADNTPIDVFLSKLLIGTGLKYSFFKDQIILNYLPPEEQVIKKKNFFSVSGTVYDENGEPLNNANIFLDGTTIGISSDIDGNYKLESIPPGLYDIVFSHVGYENAVYQISEMNGGSRIQAHQMELDLGQLEEVEVISNRINRTETSWQQHYGVFRTEILGQSLNAQKSVIENPEALDFTYNEERNSLSAFSRFPLQIRNDALGYRVSYFLESFRKEENDLRFRGKIRFRNLEPLNGSERKEWRKNRKISYYGSFNHFKKALLNSELKKEGFRIYRVHSLGDFEIKRGNELSASDILVFKGDHYEIDFKNYLAIEYRKEKESPDFLRSSSFVETLYGDFITAEGVLIKDPGNQISVLRLLRNSVRLDLSGEIMDRFGLTTYGYWAWERTADLVPINYDPKYDNL